MIGQALALPRSAGLRPARRSVAMQAPVLRVRRARGASVTRCDGYIGSPTNIIFATTVVLFLAAGRWGLAPTANKQATAGLKLQQTNRSGQFTGDPAGFTFVDTVALGALGHVIAVGIVLGLKLDGVIPW